MSTTLLVLVGNNFANKNQEAKNPGSSLAVPELGRKGFVSRYNYPNHPVNNGKTSSVLPGGLLGSRSGLIERAATSIKESHDSKRIARGKPPSEPIKEKWHRYQRKKKPGLAKNVLQQDVLLSPQRQHADRGRVAAINCSIGTSHAAGWVACTKLSLLLTVNVE